MDKIDYIRMIHLTYLTQSDGMTGKGTFITIYFIYPFLVRLPKK